MPVEFLGIAATSNGSEIQPRDGAAFDREYTLRLAGAHEENGWDRVLFAYGSGALDPNIGAAYIASKTETLQLLRSSARRSPSGTPRRRNRGAGVPGERAIGLVAHRANKERALWPPRPLRYEPCGPPGQL